MPTDPFISLEHTIVAHAPIKAVFEKWSRIEDFPSFMEGVCEMKWVDDKRFELVSEHAGSRFVSLCEITLRIPERRLAWRTLSGPDSAGVACFSDRSNGRTEVTLKMRYNPATGWSNREELTSRLRGNLERFKQLAEANARHAASEVA